MIQVIQLAIKEKRSKIQVLDKVITVDGHAAIFITLNPAGKSFLGRSVMPQTLKTLFRPIAMCAPNKQKIAEAFLYSEGFLDASNIASRTVNLFKLSSCFLSKQQHYDWGLRSLKSILESASNILQRESSMGFSSIAEEHSVTSRCILSSVLPGLVSSDRSLFFNITSEIFPGYLAADCLSCDIKASVQQVLRKPPFMMDSDSHLVEKVIQLHCMLSNRIGCLLLSPTLCGKTTLWKVLKESLVACGQHVIVHAFNPKALPREKLLGSISPGSRDWSDGILTKLVKDAASHPVSTRSWIIFDGDIDPEWIENLNSALDDNRVLTLPNGDRISLGTNVNFIFETNDITFASPATISRMGLMHLTTEDINVELIVGRWVQNQPELHRGDLKKWIEMYLMKVIPLSVQFSLYNEASPATILLNTLTQLNEFSNETNFIRNIMRGICSGMELASRETFLLKVRNLISNFTHDKFDGEEGRFKNTQSGLIATRNVRRGLEILKIWLRADIVHHLVLIGPGGCGKETLLRSALPNSSFCITVQCNKGTDPEEIVEIIKRRCRLHSSGRGHVYRPAGFSRLVLFIKDANVSRQDIYGTSTLQAFLQQLLSYGGFFNEQMTFVTLQNVQIVLSLTPVLLNKQPLHPRTASASRFLVLDDLNKSEMISICAGALSLFCATSDSCPVELGTDEGRTKAARTIVELILEANFRCFLSMTTDDAVSWAKSLFRYDFKTVGFAACLVQEAYRRISSNIVVSELKNRYNEFFRQFMKNEWNEYVEDCGTNRAAFFQSVESKSSSKSGDTIFSISHERLRQILEAGVKDYRRMAGALQLVRTPSFLQNFSEIDQVLSENGSNVILRGNPGIGCQESLRLFCFLKSWTFISPCITSQSNLSSDIKEYLKEAIELAASSNNEKICFLLEHHMLDDSTISLVDFILSSEDFSAIFGKDGDRILASLKEDMVEDGKYHDVRDYFTFQARSNLRICLCIDHTSSDFFLSTLYDHYPSLIKHCSLLTLEDWSDQGLRVACQELFQEFPSPHQENQQGGVDTLGQLKPTNFIEAVKEIHESAMTLGATPRHLVKMIKTWDMMFCRHNKKIHCHLTSLQRGLQKLVDTRRLVVELETLVESQQEDMNRAQQQANNVMESISHALREATSSRQKNEQLSTEMKEKTKKALTRKAHIHKELDKICPLLEEAKQSVQGIKSEHLSEIRALKAPPVQISVVLSAVLLIMGFSVSLRIKILFKNCFEI